MYDHLMLLPYFLIYFFLKSSKRLCIAVNETPPHSDGMSLAMWDHTVLPATRLNPSQRDWYSIYLPLRDGRLSWPRWAVTVMVYPPADSHPSKY